MNITVDKFMDASETEKLVGLRIEYNGSTLIADKRVTIVDGKTKEQYVSDAYNAALDEINAWKEDLGTIGRTFDPSTGTFVSEGE